jgi:hypothetical protein
VVDALFEQPGELRLEHRTPERVYRLASITVSEDRAEPSLAEQFELLRTNANMATEREHIAPYLEAEPDKTLASIAEMRHAAAAKEPGRSSTPARCTPKWSAKSAHCHGAREELIDELLTSDMTGWVRGWVAAFRRLFPDIQEAPTLTEPTSTRVSKRHCPPQQGQPSPRGRHGPVAENSSAPGSIVRLATAAARIRSARYRLPRPRAAAAAATSPSATRRSCQRDQRARRVVVSWSPKSSRTNSRFAGSLTVTVTVTTAPELAAATALARASSPLAMRAAVAASEAPAAPTPSGTMSARILPECLANHARNSAGGSPRQNGTSTTRRKSMAPARRPVRVALEKASRSASTALNPTMEATRVGSGAAGPQRLAVRHLL